MIRAAIRASAFVARSAVSEALAIVAEKIAPKDDRPYEHVVPPVSLSPLAQAMLEDAAVEKAEEAAEEVVPLRGSLEWRNSKRVRRTGA